jgi:hypothetical protein
MTVIIFFNVSPFQNDLLLTINGVKVLNSKHAVKLMKQAADKSVTCIFFSNNIKAFHCYRFVVKIERSSSLKGSVPASVIDAENNVKVEEDMLSFKVASDSASKHAEESEDYVNITVAEQQAQDQSSSSLDTTLEETSSSTASPASSRRSFSSILPAGSGLFHRKRSASARGSPEIKDKVSSEVKLPPEAQKPKTAAATLAVVADFAARRKSKSESNLGLQLEDSQVRMQTNSSNNIFDLQSSSQTTDSISVAESTASSNIITEPSEIPEGFELLHTPFVKATSVGICNCEAI